MTTERAFTPNRGAISSTCTDSPLPTWIGTGSVNRDGGALCRLVDIAGVSVHIGARIAALAGPREVLVSSTVKELVAGSGITFEDRGTHTLKGVPDEWRLYSIVSAPGA